jgi:regulator of protease activity HflC (stomatin/prohibitin superfamily)
MGNFVSSELNEWLIVIKDGSVIKCGIGMKTRVNPFTDTVAKFPSGIRKLEFSANQVSKEMQGIQITGVVMYSINRFDEGPFKYYKYAGQDEVAAKDNLRLLSEGIVRNTVANHTIKEIVSQRDMIRNTLKKGIMDSCSGWGIWIETVELTEVTICSKQLFNDLQAEFRQESHLAAEDIRLKSEQEINEKRLAARLRNAELEAERKKKQAIYESQQELEAQEEQAKLLQQKMEIMKQQAEQEKKVEEVRIAKEQEIHLMKVNAQAKNAEITISNEMKKKKFENEARLKGQEHDALLLKQRMEVEKAKAQHEREMQLQKIQVEDEIKNIVLQKKLKLDCIQNDHDLKHIKEKLALEGTMSDINMQKYLADKTMEIYSKLPLKSVDVHNYVGVGGGGGVNGTTGLAVEAVLPALNNFSAACKSKAL